MIENLSSVEWLQSNIEIVLPVILFSAALIWVLKPKKVKTYEKWRIKASRLWLKRFRARALEFAPAQRLTFIRKTDPYLFEEILLSSFQERGYKIQRMPFSHDGGKDGIVYLKDPNNFSKDAGVIIQAKRYKNNIHRHHVIELIETVKRDEHCTFGLFIHTGKTSSPIKSLIRSNKSIEMVSGTKALLDLLDGEEVTILGQTIRPILV